MRTVPSSEHVTNFVSTGQKLKVRREKKKKTYLKNCLIASSFNKNKRQNILNE